MILPDNSEHIDPFPALCNCKACRIKALVNSAYADGTVAKLRAKYLDSDEADNA